MQLQDDEMHLHDDEKYHHLFPLAILEMIKAKCELFYRTSF